MAADFGGGLGTVIGANMASNDLENALAANAGTADNFRQTTDPYNHFGQSFLGTATQGISNAQNFADKTQGYHDFMSSYTNTPAAQYQVEQAQAAQDSSAAARGGTLSGANLRALSGITTGLVAQNANTAYDEYLKGNNQQFGQFESIIGNMFSGIGVGTTATGQQASIDAAKIGATSQIAQAQAKNDQSKGSGFGSMFGAIGAVPFAF